MTRLRILILACLPLAAFSQQFDVVVVGATTGGVAAAIAAGRQGMKVALIEESPVLGGIMANGLSRTDGSPAACTGIYDEFVRRCGRYYQETLPDDPAIKHAAPSTLGHRYEPHVADLIFKQMVAELPGIQVFYHRYAVKVLKTGNRVTGVVTRDPDDRNEMTFHATVTIDGTHEGDLLPLAGTEFRVGREPRTAEEPHAGAIYMTHAGDAFGSGEGDGKLQAYAMLLTIQDYGPSADKTLPRPPG
jgi:flavin-dependent dehydrogenase